VLADAYEIVRPAIPSGGPSARGPHVTGQAAGSVWPSASPPQGAAALHWRLREVAELPRIRAELRRYATGPGAEPMDPDLLDQLILALDEMASNALRHGGGSVEATVRETRDAYLLEVSDSATGAPPAPAVGRDPSEGGLGLYLIAELSTNHGWYVSDGHKHVWAVLPRR
jgi:anti-sigma regulatory factor (Ser/Thr protein kinase)